jgi:protocatechuate 3,4-dioxygenase, beta subunit
MSISRRDLALGALALATSGGTLSRAMGGEQPTLRPTGQETLGPFYPVRAPASHDTDLTHYPGRKGRAQGQVIELTGRVLDINGRPLPRANLTVWQANAAGRYTNPVDKNPAPLDPDFLGVVSFRVAADGSYRLRTIKPGAYPEPSGTLRTPHVHFDVVHADYRLVAQMYFPGESLNETDILLSTLAARRRDPRAAICQPVSVNEPGVQGYKWDIILLT